MQEEKTKDVRLSLYDACCMEVLARYDFVVAGSAWGKRDCFISGKDLFTVWPSDVVIECFEMRLGLRPYFRKMVGERSAMNGTGLLL